MKLKFFAIALICFTWVGCSETDEKVSEPEEKQNFVDAWATVNETPLTDQELDRAVERFLGNQFADARVIQNIRESLIASRALALKAEVELDEDALKDIEIAVQAYREERLIAAYIKAYTNPEPVSSLMVTEYYEKNKDQFGEQNLKRLQILKVELTDSPSITRKMMATLNELAEQPEWGDLEFDDQIELISAVDNKGLPALLQATIQTLSPSETSKATKIDDSLYVVRVTGAEYIPPKPLVEVSSEIRKRLAATQLKKVIQELSESAINSSHIVKNY